MKGTITDVKRFAVHDGDGIRTTVFFKGCPLRCVWCHNPEGLTDKRQLAFYEHKCTLCGSCVSVCKAHAIEGERRIFHRSACIACGKCEEVCPSDALHVHGRKVSCKDLLPELLEDRIYYEQSGGGITLSGGECLMQARFCSLLLKACKKEGLHTAVDTCGYVPQKSFETVLPYTDVFLYDIKAYDEDVHMACTGQSSRLILNNLRYLNAKGATVEVRIPYVPQYNDGQMEKIANFLQPLTCVKKIRVLPYHDFARSKYRSLGLPDTMPEVKLPTEDELAPVRSLFGERCVK